MTAGETLTEPLGLLLGSVKSEGAVAAHEVAPEDDQVSVAEFPEVIEFEEAVSVALGVVAGGGGTFWGLEAAIIAVACAIACWATWTACTRIAGGSEGVACTSEINESAACKSITTPMKGFINFLQCLMY